MPMAVGNQRIRPIEILMIDDNLGDSEMVRETIQSIGLMNVLRTVPNGQAGIDYLRQIGEYEKMSRPDLILLDLNMPLKGGRDVLVEIKNDDRFKTIPVVILTSSRDDEDVLRSYQHHANCYITKPFGFSEMVKLVNTIERFWFSVVTLAQEPEHHA